MTSETGSLLVQLRLERQHSGRLVDGEKSSQTQIALLAGIDPRALRNIETGKAVPKLSTLEAILGALDRYIPIQRSVRQTILAGYGLNTESVYPAKELPDETVVQMATAIWQKYPGIQNYLTPAPAFLSDIGHRLLDYNALFIKSVGRRPDDPLLTGLRGRTIYDLIFDFIPRGSNNTLPANSPEYLPSVVTAWKHELWPYRYESWYWTRVDEARQRYPEFKRLWDSIPDGPPPFPPVRSSTPIVLRAQGVGNFLSFGVLMIPLVSDDRLRIIQLVPTDHTTTLQCQLWASELEQENARQG